MAEQTMAEQTMAEHASIVAKINKHGTVSFEMTISEYMCGILLHKTGFIIHRALDHKTFYEHKYAASAEACVAHFIDIVHVRGLVFDDITGAMKVAGTFLSVQETAFMTRKDPSECCVCMEPTFQKTKCGHSICRRCTYKLTELICPLCRAEMEEENEDE